MNRTMSKYTKTANFTFRGAITVAIATAAAGIATGAKIFKPIIIEGNDIQNITKQISYVSVEHLGNLVHMVALALVIAAVLSVAAFKSSNMACTIGRTITLIGMAILSAMSGFMISSADMVARNIQGTATSTSYKTADELMTIFAESNRSANGVALSGMVTAGYCLLIFVTLVLAVLLITSVISVIKTVRASAPCAA